jgi:tetratricopeptide (TPR) repeat protein
MAGALFDQALQAHRQGRFDEAEALYRRIAKPHPRAFDALHLRGLLRHQQGSSEEALGLIEVALLDRPEHALAWASRAMVLARLGQRAEAVASWDRSLGLEPDNAAGLHSRGTLLREIKRPEDALASFDRALTLKPDFIEALVDRGNALLDFWRVEEALACYDQALALDPDFAAARDNRGFALIELGRFDEAAQAIEDAIERAPERVHSRYLLTLLPRRWTAEDRHLQALENLARNADALAAQEQVELHFALGKALAGIEPDSAFRHLLAGNAERRRHVEYDEAATLAMFGRLRASYGEALMRRRAGCGDLSETPVFIFGMPRSGTSLVEQILASHPDVYGAGEIEDFQKTAGELGHDALQAPEAGARLSDAELRAIGTRYVARLPGAGAARVTNKLPWNFLAAGLIHLALPKARLIHIGRDPVDTCLSCFSHLFAANLPYSYDLGELGRYYRAYDGLMAHWRRVLPPGVLLDVQYEALVADLEGESRRMLAHCGLGWDARCVDFHRTERPVRTASMTQVRRPIYRGAVGRWRAYEAFLAPLFEALGPAMPAPEP